MTVTRVVIALVAALVAGLNQALGWHLSAADVAGVVVPLVMLIIADMHHERAQSQQYYDRLIGGLVPLLRDVLQAAGQQRVRPAATAAVSDAPEESPKG